MIIKIMQKNNETKKLRIIDNILILGLKTAQLNSIQSSTINQIEEDTSNYKCSILSNYTLYNKTTQLQNEDEFYKSICDYSFPNGVISSSENINLNKKQYITFSIKDFNGHLKHITCSYIQFGLKIDDGNIVTINSGIALVSFLDIYETHKEILSHIIDLITNYFSVNSNNNRTLKEVFCGNKIFEEYRLLPFYFSFFLNLSLDDYYNLDKIKNICLINISNNYFQNIFCKISLNPKNKNSILSLKEYDTSIILEKFYIDDILKLYYALLLDRSIIFLFNDYSEINIIITSLLSITFPLDKLKKYNIKYIYNKSVLQSKKLLKKDQLNTIYLIYYTEEDDLSFLPEEGRTPSMASTKNTNININIDNNDNSYYYPCLNFYYYKDTFVYSIKEKSFLNCPLERENKNAFIQEEIHDEIKSQLYFTMGEKLVINSDMNFEETDLGLLFDNSTCNKINSFLYLNLKIKSIFFKCFLMILNGFNSLINFNYKFNKDNFSITEFFDVKNKIIKGSRLKYYLIRNKNFQEFLVNYIKKYKHNEKYMFIYKTLNEIKDKNFIDMNKYFENVFKDHIKNGIINYYNFDYINLEKYFKEFLSFISKNNNDNNNKDIIDEYILKSSTVYNFYQLLNFDSKTIEKCNLFFKNSSFKDFLEIDISCLNKFQLYKIYRAININLTQSSKKLYSLKPPSSNIYNTSNLNSYNNILGLKKIEKKPLNLGRKKNNISNIDNIFGQILKAEGFTNQKKEIINNEPKIETDSESKKLKFKKVNKNSSPYSKGKTSDHGGRNPSSYHCSNHPFLKNNNQMNKRKNAQFNKGKEIKSITQSFREKNTYIKSKNKIIKNNILIEIDPQIDNIRERSRKRKNTYNLEESNRTLKKFGLNKSNNNKINNNRIRKDKIKKKQYGPNSSSKKYENNCGHLPKLAGDLDDDLISDED